MRKIRLNYVDKYLCQLFYQVGLWVGRRPVYFVLVPVLLAATCITGYQRIRYETDPEYLFSPLDGPGKTERAVVEEHFKVNYSHYFSLERITRAGRFGHVIVTSKDENPNILRAEVWNELRQLDSIIRNTTINYEDDVFTYEKLCARWDDHCSPNNILNLYYILSDPAYNESNILFPVMFNPVTFDLHILPIHFGGTVVDENNTVVSLPAVQLGYFIAVDTKLQNEMGLAWEEAFLNVIGKAEEDDLFKHISVARFASSTLASELEENTKTITPYFTGTLLLMGVFSIITCMNRDGVRSKPWIGFLGNFSAVTATVSAFGLCIYFDVPFIGLNLAAPFLMIGIGIDDTFVMLAAWRKTNIMDPVPIRMAETLREAAVSISITSITDMISLFTGIGSQFPSVNIFCIYSGFAVVFTFIFHVTFFSGCLAISGYAEKNNRHSITCLKVQPLSKSGYRSRFYRLFCAGGIDSDSPSNPVDNPENSCMSWFRDSLGSALNRWWIKAFVIIMFSIYLAGAIYGFGRLEEGLDRRKLSKEDSYSIEFYDREDAYYHEFPYRIQVIISGENNYSDPVIQAAVEELTSTLENTKWIASDTIYTTNWLRTFQESNNMKNYTSEKDFIRDVKSYYNPINITDPRALDIKYDESGEHIVATRYLIQAVNVTGTEEEKEMVRELREICKSSILNATVFHPYFIYFDQFELVRPTSISNMIWGAVTMVLVSFIFIPNVACSIWVGFCIFSIEIGVVGYMALWGVNLDSISMINLVMCLGFSVDFTAHICYAYMSSKQKRPDERVKECLYSLGWPIVQGATSTILGLLALLLAGTYIFLVFFKMVFLVIVFGAMHGLFLLPVLLSIFGPGSCTNHDKVELKAAKKKALEASNYNNSVANLPIPFSIPHPTLIYGNNMVQKECPSEKLGAFEDRDLGLGTSEDSNSSGSSKSRRSQSSSDNYHELNHFGWRQSVSEIPSLSQFQVNQSPPPDYPAATADVIPRALRNSQQFGYPVYPITMGINKVPKRDYRRSQSQQNLSRTSGQHIFDPKYA